MLLKASFESLLRFTRLQRTWFLLVLMVLNKEWGPLQGYSPEPLWALWFLNMHVFQEVNGA